ALLYGLAPDAVSKMAIVLLPAWIIWAGAVVLFAGVALTVAAQLGMGASWRIGIDRDARPGLVTTGLYTFCRNPIYLALIARCVGSTLMLTTWYSVALAVGIFWVIRSQTLQEEAYLQQTYGLEFRSYAARVGRFWPGVGRLAPVVLER